MPNPAGARAELDFKRDDTLVCGLAVAASGHKLEWNVASYLDQVEARMRELVSGPSFGEQGC
jgi:hypothetical protein